MDSEIRNLLSLAVRAPSGDNMQPWRFVLSGNKLEIHNISERDDSLYNWNQYGSYIAHGALLENIHLLAPEYGLRANVTLIDDDVERKNIIAEVYFDKVDKSSRVWTQWITKRQTNRTKYADTPLPEVLRKNFEEIASNRETQISLKFFTDNTERLKISKLFAMNEVILFSNPHLRKFFLSHIRWNSHSGVDKFDDYTGLTEDSLALPPQAPFILRIMKSEIISNVLNLIRFPRLIAHDNSKIYSSGAAIVICTSVSPPSGKKSEYVSFGRTLQKLWLETTKHQFAFQPLMGIIFLSRRIHEGGEGITKKEQRIIQEATRQLSRVSDAKPENILGAFRIGIPGQSTPQTPRLDPHFS